MLPRLRNDLDLMPSPVEERPGLLIRDPFHFSDATLIIPPELVQCLSFFDGEQSELDLRAYLVRLSGQLEAGGLALYLQDTLSQAGFLEDEAFAKMKETAHKGFAEAALRLPVHAGGGYPDEPAELSKTIAGYLLGGNPAKGSKRVRAIAAPHVSPFGGVATYRAAYSALRPEDADKTFVILGTSHYGEPDRFGLTRKPFVTPFGETRTDLGIIGRLEKEAPGAILEDYCHAVEHSIEFQVVFLQHLYGPQVKIAPILCGSYARSIYQGGKPEDNEQVHRALSILGEIAAKEEDRLVWVMGVDMAHMGARYGDNFEAAAGSGEMERVEQRDKARIARMESSDAQGFWELVQENRDDLKWCGSAPIYTFLKAVPEARGQLLHYEQWNIDPQSVVSFGALRFLSNKKPLLADKSEETYMTSLETKAAEPQAPYDYRQCLEQCYVLALRSAADYALDFDNRVTKELQKHIHALEGRVAGETSTEVLRSIQASFRGELRDYRDKAQSYLRRLKADLEDATAMMRTFAGTFVANGADVEQKVRGQLSGLEAAADSNDLGRLKQSVRSAAQEILRSYDELNKANQLVIAELQHEIRLLHREMESERKAAWTDAESGAWVKRKIDNKLEDLLKASDPFCVIVILVHNLKRLEMQCSKSLVSGALAALVKRCYGVVGEGSIVARLSEDQFATVLEVESSTAQAIAHELTQRLSSRYSVQENGIAQNIALRITCGAVDRVRNGDPTEFHRRLQQMTGVDHTPVADEDPA